MLDGYDYDVLQALDKVQKGELSAFPSYMLKPECIHFTLQILLEHMLEELDMPIEMVYEYISEAYLGNYGFHLIFKNVNFKKYIDLAPELKDNRAKALIYYFYKKKLCISEQTLTETLYKKILNREIKNFPKNYFIGHAGENRYKICLEYYAKINNIPISTPIERKNNINPLFMKNSRLIIGLATIWDSIPLMLFDLYGEAESMSVSDFLPSPVVKRARKKKNKNPAHIELTLQKIRANTYAPITSTTKGRNRTYLNIDTNLKIPKAPEIMSYKNFSI